MNDRSSKSEGKPVATKLVLILSVLLAPLGTGCTRFAMLDALVPTAGYVRSSDIAYGNLPRERLDIYQPTHAAKPLRIAIFFYGGDWQNGRKEDYRFVGQALASQGFVAVLADYRLYPQVQFPAFVRDGARAIRWVHDHAHELGGDTNHIYLMGHSAGAHIVALLTLDGEYLREAGLDRSAIAAAACLSGPYDFVPGEGDRGVFGMKREQTTTYPAMEPINFVDGREPPMLLLQGAKDETVDAGNAWRLFKKMGQAGGAARLVIYPDRAHVGVVLALAKPFRWLAPVLEDSVRFFQEH